MIKVQDIEIEGVFSVTATLDRSKHTPILKISGVIQTPVRLPPEFDTLTCSRGYCKDIVIISESFGSEDDNIVYTFEAGEYDITKSGGEDDGEDSDGERTG